MCICIEIGNRKMALKITLKPFEKIIIAGAVIKNGKVKSQLMV